MTMHAINETKRDLFRANNRRLALFVTIVDMLLDRSGEDLLRISEQAGVSMSAMYFWMNGTTTNPRIDTLTKVANVLGYEIVLRKMKAHVPPLRLVKR
jgi:transcriptional regulator with XRE-family HTH domain